MIAKSPDYIITEYGCPQWRSEDRRTDDLAALFSSYEVINDANRRLLPLRETLTDYYSTTLAKLRLEALTESKRINITLGITQTQRLVVVDPAKVKQLKMQRNEAVRMHQQPQEQQQNHHHQEYQQHQKNSRNSTANNLDRSQHKSTTTTARRRRERRTTTTAATSDNDLDVF